MTAKPIALMKVSPRLPFGSGGRPFSLREIIEILDKSLIEKLPDYHVIIFPSLEVEDFELQIFRPEESKELDIEKLKEEVRQFIKNQSNENNHSTSN